MDKWSDESILKSIKSPCPHKQTSELTFYGFPNKPDYASITIEMIPTHDTIELKSFKEYLLQFRNKHVSYERILDVIFVDIVTVYNPAYIKITLETNPRGGISSILEREQDNRRYGKGK